LTNATAGLSAKIAVWAGLLRGHQVEARVGSAAAQIARISQDGLGLLAFVANAVIAAESTKGKKEGGGGEQNMIELRHTW
jgi:hypothetical protein